MTKISTETMQAIVNTGPGQVEWRTLPLPEPGPGQVRIRTLACGVCATDLEMIAGWSRTGFPAIPGHEWCGKVEALGPDVDLGLSGLRCVAENVLVDGGEVGFEHNGGYGEAFVTEAANLHPLPADYNPAAATLIEPLAVCVRGWQRMGLKDTTAALVLGDGPIGLLMLLLLERAGIKRRCLVGGQQQRLTLAEESAGAETLNYHEVDCDLAVAIGDTFGCEFPNVIEASGSPSAMAAAMQVAACGGRVLVLSDYGENCANFPWNRILHRELELIGSNASAGAWDEAVRLAVEDQLPLHSLVTTRLPVEQYTRALTLARTARDQVKIVMEWSHENW